MTVKLAGRRKIRKMDDTERIGRIKQISQAFSLVGYVTLKQV